MSGVTIVSILYGRPQFLLEHPRSGDDCGTGAALVPGLATIAEDPLRSSPVWRRLRRRRRARPRFGDDCGRPAAIISAAVTIAEESHPQPDRSQQKEFS